ncbi:virulence membrane protein PagC [Xenorhabdus stockiae]|uniref:Virulence membrane protein PagC n=1 Tax=Xenorhabdus stockiae TaxID=351614 RepID=A0A2D0KM87_9GAMM|nr:Ail/Lom family outer membrane beta-barrel protein [Xenorhabdus stockiae]PHM64425.1 virulence membrane protein PagC [Xenorhabdus stockiae]
MVTKKVLIITLVMPFFIYGSLAKADTQTFGIGYSNSQISTPANTYLDGVNIHYRYEWDSPVSIIGTFTHMRGNTNQVVQYTNSASEAHQNTLFEQPIAFKSKYFSLMVGPAYRINDYLSIYSLIGIAHVTNSAHKISIDTNDGSVGTGEANPAASGGFDILPTSDETLKSNELAYGAGIEINPVKNFSVYLAYEVTRSKHAPRGSRNEGVNNFINGFNVGVGYRF